MCHLVLPFKKTEPVPRLPDALHAYIAENFKSISPEAFRGDISRFCKLRKDAVEAGVEAHPEYVARLLRYNASIVYLLSKLPADIGEIFPWSPTFRPAYTLHTPPPVLLPTLLHEQFAVLYNLAACYANLGGAEGRTTSESIKKATASYQHAAGLFDHLLALLPDLPSLDHLRTAALDFKPGFLETMKLLCEAMAQECAWQLAVLDKYKDSLVAKLAIKVSELYEQALAATEKDSAATVFPANWIALMRVKQHHFAAAANFRLSVEDLGKNRYGQEIARLELASTLVKKALDSAKKGIVSDAVIADVKGFSAMLATNLSRSKRDNDLIYLDGIPAAHDLSNISGAMMAKPSLPAEVKDPIGWLSRDGGGLSWEGLLDWGVHVAISVYSDRKDSFVRDEIVSLKTEIDQVVTTTLNSLNLPQSLQAIERPMGLPPSLLGISEEVRRERGPERVRQMMENVASSRSTAEALINEMLDLLDSETEDDEAFRASHPALRPASHELNGPLVEKANAYKKALEQAGDSDRLVREKWEDWEDAVEVLAGDEDTLKSYVPALPRGSSLNASPITRLLHTLLESLTDLSASRTQLTASARALAQRDDPSPLIISEADAIRRQSRATSPTVKPEWFETLFERELQKYRPTLKDMEANGAEVERLLDEVRERNEEFLAGRKTSPAILAREEAMKGLEVAGQKYREIVKNLGEGTKFYSDLLQILTRIRDECKEWVWSRRTAIDHLTASLEQAQLRERQQQQQQYPYPAPPSPPPQASSPPFPPPPPAPPVPSSRPAFNLSGPGSSAWEASSWAPSPTAGPASPAPRQQAAPPPPASANANATPRRSTRKPSAII